MFWPSACCQCKVVLPVFTRLDHFQNLIGLTQSVYSNKYLNMSYEQYRSNQSYKSINWLEFSIKLACVDSLSLYLLPL